MPGDYSLLARYLISLLNRPPYRDRWLVFVERQRSETVNQAAVAKVIATYLVDAGIVPESAEARLPRKLRSTISRALQGQSVSTQTVYWFIDAFDFEED